MKKAGPRCGNKFERDKSGNRPIRFCAIGCYHRCDNPPCVNPEHLFIGTHADNVADKVAKGRQRGSRKCHLRENDVREILREKKRRGKPQILAKKYGVSREAIRLIQARKIWKHVNI